MKRFFKHCLFASCFLWLTALLPAQAMAAEDFKIITLTHTFAADLLPTIHEIVGNEGTASGTSNILILRASPEKISEIEQVIASLDTPRANLKITVRRQDNLQSSNRDIAVSGQKRIGNVVIGTRPYRNRNSNVQINVEDNKISKQSNSEQFINVIDGGQAYIRVGQSVPFTQEWVTYMHRYIHVQRSTEFVEISTGFAVHIRSIGEQFELEITPRIAQLNQQGYIDFEELSTKIRVNKGEWIDLGNTMQQKDEVSRAILRSSETQQSQENVLTMRIDLRRPD